MFYSDEIPHEVLPSHATRHSFTVWYYDDDEHKAATSRAGDAAVADSRTTHAPATSTSDARNLGADRQTCADLDLDEQRQDISDRAATAFVRTLMTERVTPAEATALAARLDPRASVAVASVFGAPDVEVRPTHRSPCDRVRAVHAVP
jgi:hypoxia-inducible factor (prolyl hydroxylase)